VKFLHLTWSDVQRLCEVVAGKMRGDGYRPDVVVGVSRGGFDPARILCDQLMVKRLASFQIEYYNAINEKSKVPKVIYPLNADVRGMRVLVVDDVSDSGHSLETAKRHVSERGASEVRVATLHYKPWSSFEPDYYAEGTESWVVYPWEVKECLLGTVERLRSKGLHQKAIHEELLRKGFKEKQLRKYLAPLEDA